MSAKELESIANTLATRLLALDTLKKSGTDEYVRVAGELFHVSELLTEKESN